MKTLAFLLLLGQAGVSPQGGGGLTVVPLVYHTLEACEAAGEEARRNNLGLSYLSYTCVPNEAALPARIK